MRSGRTAWGLMAFGTASYGPDLLPVPYINRHILIDFGRFEARRRPVSQHISIRHELPLVLPLKHAPSNV